MHGTAVNGDRIFKGKYRLKNGDRVTLGETVVQGNSNLIAYDSIQYVTDTKSETFGSRAFQVRYREEP